MVNAANRVGGVNLNPEGMDFPPQPFRVVQVPLKALELAEGALVASAPLLLILHDARFLD